MRTMATGTTLGPDAQRHVVGRQNYVCFVEYTDDTWTVIDVQASGVMGAKRAAGVGTGNVWGADCMTEDEWNDFIDMFGYD